MNKSFPADPVSRRQPWRKHRAVQDQNADELRLPGRRTLHEPFGSSSSTFSSSSSKAPKIEEEEEDEDERTIQIRS
jgi:hypothetical protein